MEYLKGHAINMQRLKILLYSFGVIYFLFFIYDVQLLIHFNILNLYMFGGSLFFFCLLINFIKRNTIQKNQISDLKNENKIIQNRFNECNQSVNSLLNNAVNGIALLNLELDFFKTNKNFCDVFGYTSDEILMWNLGDILSFSSLSKHKIAINQLIVGKSDSYSFKTKIIKKNGDSIWLSVTMAVIRDSMGKAHYFIIYVNNTLLEKQKDHEEHSSS